MVLPQKERAILVGVETPGKGAPPLLDSLEELASLTGTAGAEVTGTLTQSRDKPDLRYYIGTGKLEELKARAASTNSNLVVFDCELTPSQTRNLEEELGIKVIDRTELILDIFAQRAHSREGKLQVELAQANYTLTHLSGKGVLMSRLGGGIGTRGPGETKLEMDRRVINKKISTLYLTPVFTRITSSLQRLTQQQGASFFQMSRKY
ncbi:MAG: GTPase HflX [Candidatus Saganbacteria bacterium]|nr:GTPase HflX [Candidatus Saganbacteria bacterium]